MYFKPQAEDRREDKEANIHVEVTKATSCNT